MELRTSVDIDSPRDVVWSVLMDLERWPQWTQTVSFVERLDQAEFGLGSRVRIRQPRLFPATWRVSAFEHGRYFTWETRSVGIKMVAGHVLEATGRGTTVTLTLVQTGWLLLFFKYRAERLARNYIETEALGLQRRCQQSKPPG